jgi:outer membrane protein assembly factor BamB
MGWSASCTPTIADGKCYLLSSEAIVYCLDAKTGREIWKSEFIGKEGNAHNRSSSPLVVDGTVVVVTTQNAVGLDAASGKVLWRDAQAQTEYGSAVPWTSGGKTYAVMLAGRAHCFEPKTGRNLWERASGGNGASPVIVGDTMAVKDNNGLMLCRMEADAPKRLWRINFADAFTTPTIHDGHVYVFGGAFDNKPTRAVCVEAASGRVAWDEAAGPFEFSSPTVADGKIILVGRDTLYLIKATPEKYTELARARLGLRSWTAVGFVDGRIFLRAKDRAVCYDLRR